MDGTCQRERLKSTDGEIFDQAKTHALLPVFPVNAKAGAATSAMRYPMCIHRTASYVNRYVACIKKRRGRLDVIRPLQRDRMIVLH